MSLMGNDFLPHSLTHKLSDDGHEFVMDCVKRDLIAGISLIGSDGNVSLSVLKSVFDRWAVDEEDRLLHLIRKKKEQAVRGVGKGMAEEEGLALKWDVEAAFLEGRVREYKLKDEWKHVYWTFLHKSYDIDYVCKEYIKGFQWIIDYYTGKPVNKTWIFPAWLPPLWSNLAEILDKQKDVSLHIMDYGEVSPKPQEQLAMVLPLESWGLIRDPILRRLPVAAPQMWPKGFGFVSVGRKWLWECEARIPVLTAERVRQICE
jgi:5'-3' exonuclease